MGSRLDRPGEPGALVVLLMRLRPQGAATGLAGEGMFSSMPWVLTCAGAGRAGVWIGMVRGGDFPQVDGRTVGVASDVEEAPILGRLLGDIGAIFKRVPIGREARSIQVVSAVVGSKAMRLENVALSCESREGWWDVTSGRDLRLAGTGSLKTGNQKASFWKVRGKRERGGCPG